MLKQALLFILSVACFQSCVVIPTYKSEIKLTTIEHDSVPVKIENVLLIGAGKIPARLFLENLSGRMGAFLKAQNVQSNFLFMNTIPVPFKIKDTTYSTETHDSYLVFKSAYEGYLDMNNKKFIAAGPGVYGESFGNQYLETFIISLYKQKETLQLIWRGKLELDFDIVNEQKYQKISNLIYKELLKKNVLIK